MSATMSAFVILSVAATSGATAPATPVAHAAEIKAFASTMAIAKTASDVCENILVNAPMLGDLMARFHIVEADKPAFAEETRAVVEALSQGINSAPSRKAWCDAAYRLYGPRGSMMPCLLNQ